MKLLEMNHIKKEFDGLGVLKDISLSVEEGEIVSIIRCFCALGLACIFGRCIFTGTTSCKQGQCHCCC